MYTPKKKICNLNPILIMLSSLSSLVTYIFPSVERPVVARLCLVMEATIIEDRYTDSSEQRYVEALAAKEPKKPVAPKREPVRRYRIPVPQHCPCKRCRDLRAAEEQDTDLRWASMKESLIFWLCTAAILAVIAFAVLLILIKLEVFSNEKSNEK